MGRLPSGFNWQFQMTLSKNIQQVTLYTILFSSGFAGLGYEMVWTRMLAVGLGHEIVAVLAVVAAFFCGMALGAWSLDGSVSRSRQPGRWYAALELTIGIWSLVLIFLIPPANRFAGLLAGGDPSMLRHWFVAFALPFFLLLPATFAMGATLPAMERFFSRLSGDGWSVGGLYAANTFGAVAGTLVTTFLLAPTLGFRATCGLLAIVNFLCVVGVMSGPARNEIRRAPVSVTDSITPDPKRVMITLFLTGFIGIGYEVLVVRVACQILENTVYSFASLLAVYLMGTAAGAALYQAIVPRRKFELILTCLLQSLAFFCLTGIAVLSFAEHIFLALRNLMGGGMPGAVAGEMGIAASVFFLPTLIMGATFSHLAQASRTPSGGVGQALAINTLGGAMSPLVFGVFLLPALGARLCLLAASTCYLFLIPMLPWKRWLPAAVPLGLAAMLWLNPFGLSFITLPLGSRVVKHIEGVMADVSVIEDQRADFYLQVNNKFVMGGTASRFSDWRQGHIPLLLHPNPKTALFLGLGTGATFAGSEDHPQLVAHGVELVPEVVKVLPYFEKSTGPLNQYERLRIHVADARRFVNACHQSFDVVVADLFHPARDGAGFLYTVEHFKAIRSLLNTGGIFCQWLPLYQMDLDVLRIIIRTFMHVFPNGRAFIATYSLETPIIGLIAGAEDIFYPIDYIEKRVTDDRLRKRLKSLRLANTYSFFGNFIAGNRDLNNFAGTGPLNTDDDPIIIFSAPQFVYSKHDPAYVRLLSMLTKFNPTPDQILGLKDAASEKLVGERLVSYWRARNDFLEAGIGVEQTSNVERMLQQIKDPLLSIVRESSDFEAAYNPLLAMAQQLHKSDPQGARQLLVELESANPNRRDAKRLLEYLSN